MNAHPGNTSLIGRRVLVVEDEALIAMFVEDELGAAGCTVVGPAPSVVEALWLVEHEAIDVAVLDYRLGSETSLAIAVRLLVRKIPFLFMTGQASHELPNAIREQICLAKPVQQGDLTTALKCILIDESSAQ